MFNVTIVTLAWKHTNAKESAIVELPDYQISVTQLV